LRGMPDLQAQHSCAIPARYTFLRTRDIIGPVKSKNDWVLLSRMRALHEARARHRVLLRETVKGFFFCFVLRKAGCGELLVAHYDKRGTLNVDKKEPGRTMCSVCDLKPRCIEADTVEKLTVYCLEGVFHG